MSKYGQIMQVGNKLCSTYKAENKMMKHLINDYYNEQYKIAKTPGFAGYGTQGMFRAIMGKEITAGVFASNNIMTALGARPYDHEGVRINYKLAKKGGIGTTRDGRIPESVKAPITEIRQPYKELPFAYDVGLSLPLFEGKDDVASKDQYVEIMSTNYADSLDYDLLRPINVAQPTDPETGEEITLTGLSRVLSSSAEVGKTYNNALGPAVEITGDMVSPYGGVASDLYKFRGDTGKINNLCAYVDNEEGALSDADLNKLFANCQPYWANQGATNNKFIALSIVALEKIGALMQAKNLYLESVYAQSDFNGVKGYPGREMGGILASSWRNVIMLTDGNLNYDAETDRIGTGMGEISMVDTDHNWLSMVTPVEFRSTDDYSITRVLREQSVIMSRMELRFDRSLGSGKCVNKTA